MVLFTNECSGRCSQPASREDIPTMMVVVESRSIRYKICVCDFVRPSIAADNVRGGFLALVQFRVLLSSQRSVLQ